MTSTFTIGGDLEVNRLGYGAMQLPGPGVWGESRDPEGALAVLRRAVELGVTLIDTADAYGPFIADQLIKEALHPYAANLVIATKVGFTRQGPGQWTAVGRPEYLRQQTELSLRHLGLEQIDLMQLHRIDHKIPLSDQIGELALLRQEGKIRHIGLSEVTVDEIEAACEFAPISSVQNRYNLTLRTSEQVLDHCTANTIAFIPYSPLAKGTLLTDNARVARTAQEHGATRSQIALAWLLKRSPVTLPIPGTASIPHLEDNLKAENITLTDAQFTALTA